MKILAIADHESKYYWDFYEKEKLEDIDLIISCGDLDKNYLEFLATFSNVPVLYVHGNHDQKYDQNPPGGCTCIEDDIFVYNGVRILGLGGSMKYSMGEVTHQYTEVEMIGRIIKIGLKILFHKGFDILVTHAPASGINDGTDLPHRGFKSFIALLDQHKPKFFLHGHVHMSYGRNHKRYTKYNETHIINAYEKCLFEYEDENIAEHIY